MKFAMFLTHLYIFPGDYETGQLTKYDAFILYAPEDQEFVDLIVDKMEEEHGLRVTQLAIQNIKSKTHTCFL